MKKMKFKHGGKRKGSGRKPHEHSGKTISVVLPETLIKKIDAHKNRSKFVREIFEEILK